MFPSSWRNWLQRTFQSIRGRGRRRPSQVSALLPRRPQLERLEDRTVPTVALTSYNGLNFGQTAAIQAFTIGGAATPPDPQGAVGPFSYVEAVNLSVAIFSPRTNGINPVTDALDDFFSLQGNLHDANESGDPGGAVFTDPEVVFDNQAQRFIIGATNFDPSSVFGTDFRGDNSTVYDIAVSKTANPLSLTTADWNFYQVDITERNSSGKVAYISDYPGNLGFNGGALVVTYNEFALTDLNHVDHVLVNAINLSDLTSGVAQANLHIYQTDFDGVSLRPTTMHDSTTADD